MKKNVSEISVTKSIQSSLDYSAKHYGNSIQFDIEDPQYYASFLQFLENISDISRIDGRKFNKFRRKPIKKQLAEILPRVETSIRVGIKAVHSPLGKLSPWDEWEGGYIEGFARMDGDGDYDEYFTWFYIKMDHLETILSKFSNQLFFYD